MLRFVSVSMESVDGTSGTFEVPRDAIYSNLEDTPTGAGSDVILVYDAALVEDGNSNFLKLTITESRNGVPYRAPRAVTAAGGYVVRTSSRRPGGLSEVSSRLSAEDLDVLLIHRRGVWDLPKGKLDTGESVEEAALREVREEVGVEDLRIIKPLGTTVHGYSDGNRFAVKTTHWFLMETSATRFVPQAVEQIEDVRWMAWREALEMIGYETIRAHMGSMTP